jgi:IS5 family transposase
LKRRNAIEPIIGHLKNDGLLGRNYLKGELGDAMHAILCAAGHNIRLILRQLRIFWPWLWEMLRRFLETNPTCNLLYSA